MVSNQNPGRDDTKHRLCLRTRLPYRKNEKLYLTQVGSDNSDITKAIMKMLPCIVNSEHQPVKEQQEMRAVEELTRCYHVR